MYRLIFATILACLTTTPLGAQQKIRPYRLNAVDLKQRIIWGAESRFPDGSGLFFGGQDQDADTSANGPNRLASIP